jgi:putative ABC transport system ATP-binding protein
MYYGGADDAKMREVAENLANQVGLGHRLHHKPTELSGGQQQRVAIARALSNSPLVILADEATGNLDSKSGQEILNLFDDLNAQGKTLVFVTHDERMIERATRVIRLKDGVVELDERGKKKLG